ncbi:glutamine ABC transporter ATP-binding protein [Gammaproteobacteria bacterium ESL0073]|uniref:Amino acid ABC transporter ATP-binding protein n=1 Tax=Entomomonas moraniae TaxID=2213226 RepID=A0A3Q9JHJ4_9GAMM|nr:amino acid ABC transporter ATP-binding protein [Entomomonas moraniae]AWM80667.1 glutamine ABC transporter ATP-binding protein [Gammaproteobacteria bacterium ESL0073]AZS49696.1 amino acid ABC transporter ATP-binding protein [Entomomonas moraniae]
MIENSEVLLQVTDLHKRFGDREILKGIDLSVHKGEVIAILGPSGCGKSTFLRCLNGLEPIQQGSILFEGFELNSPSTSWICIRQKIGMVFQSYDLFPNMNVIDNILLGPLKVQKRNKDEVMKEADELLNRVGLLDRKQAFPRQLSGGQKQRIAIVRALCMNPDIMLFDEVTASLDPEMVREVLEVIQDLAKQGMTMILVTHELNFARRVADQIVFMDQGKIIETAEPEQFFNAPQTERAKQFLTVFDF